LAGFVDSVSAVKFAIFGEVDAVSDRDTGALSRVLSEAGEQFAVVGDGEVNVLVVAAQSVNEEGGNVRQSASLGAESFGVDRQSFGNIRDFRGHIEDPGPFALGFPFWRLGCFLGRHGFRGA